MVKRYFFEEKSKKIRKKKKNFCWFWFPNVFKKGVFFIFTFRIFILFVFFKYIKCRPKIKMWMILKMNKGPSKKKKKFYNYDKTVFNATFEPRNFPLYTIPYFPPIWKKILLDEYMNYKKRVEWFDVLFID